MRNPAVRPLARSEHGNGPSCPAAAAGEQAPGASIRRLLHGSVSRYCRGHSHCPVIVVPAAPGRGYVAGS